MAARFGGDGAALVEGIGACADDLEIQGAGVPVLVQDADIADQVDLTPSVGLQFWFAGSLLAAQAVADMDVAHVVDHRCDRFDRVFVGAVDVGGVHVYPESG